MTYDEIVARRRALRIDGYLTLADVGFDGDWVTPYQKASCSPDGPVLVAYNWLDAPSVETNRVILEECGFLPDIMFNNVLDKALAICGIRRRDLYITQAFHLLPNRRSGSISARDIDKSFEAITRHELVGRRVIALGTDAAAACLRHSVRHTAVRHPSARGPGLTHDAKARELARAISEVLPFATPAVAAFESYAMHPSV